jgi:hypothetical protein
MSTRDDDDALAVRFYLPSGEVLALGVAPTYTFQSIKEVRLRSLTLSSSAMEEDSDSSIAC